MATLFYRNQLPELWIKLTKIQKVRLILCLYNFQFKNFKQLIPRLKFPVNFAIQTTVCMFTLLAILPFHPMSIPTAIGGGLAFALIIH